MSQKRGEAGSEKPGQEPGRMAGEDDLDRRRRELDAAIAARAPAPSEKGGAAKSGSMAGAAHALKLSSEFIAGIVVGAAIGWLIDSLAGTSPFGLIVFLLLGFGAGVLNALRSAGMVADVGLGKPSKGADPDRKE
jgi:ATP synthase protein I